MKIQGFAPRSGEPGHVREGVLSKIDKTLEFSESLAFSVNFWKGPVSMLAIVFLVLGVAVGIVGIVVVCAAPFQATAEIDATFSLGLYSMNWGVRFLLSCLSCVFIIALFEKFIGRSPRDYIRGMLPKLLRTANWTAAATVLVCVAIALCGFF